MRMRGMDYTFHLHRRSKLVQEYEHMSGRRCVSYSLEPAPQSKWRFPHSYGLSLITT